MFDRAANMAMAIVKFDYIYTINLEHLGAMDTSTDPAASDPAASAPVASAPAAVPESLITAKKRSVFLQLTVMFWGLLTQKLAGADPMAKGKGGKLLIYQVLFRLTYALTTAIANYHTRVGTCPYSDGCTAAGDEMHPIEEHPMCHGSIVSGIINGDDAERIAKFHGWNVKNLKQYRDNFAKDVERYIYPTLIYLAKTLGQPGREIKALFNPANLFGEMREVLTEFGALASDQGGLKTKEYLEIRAKSLEEIRTKLAPIIDANRWLLDFALIGKQAGMYIPLRLPSNIVDQTARLLAHLRFVNPLPPSAAISSLNMLATLAASRVSEPAPEPVPEPASVAERWQDVPLTPSPKLVIDHERADEQDKQDDEATTMTVTTAAATVTVTTAAATVTVTTDAATEQVAHPGSLMDGDAKEKIAALVHKLNEAKEALEAVKNKRRKTTEVYSELIGRTFNNGAALKRAEKAAAAAAARLEVAKQKHVEAWKERNEAADKDKQAGEELKQCEEEYERVCLLLKDEMAKLHPQTLEYIRQQRAHQLAHQQALQQAYMQVQQQRAQQQVQPLQKDPAA